MYGRHFDHTDELFSQVQAFLLAHSSCCLTLSAVNQRIDRCAEGVLQGHAQRQGHPRSYQDTKGGPGDLVKGVCIISPFDLAATLLLPQPEGSKFFKKKKLLFIDSPVCPRLFTHLTSYIIDSDFLPPSSFCSSLFFFLSVFLIFLGLGFFPFGLLFFLSSPSGCLALVQSPLYIRVQLIPVALRGSLRVIILCQGKRVTMCTSQYRCVLFRSVPA